MLPTLRANSFLLGLGLAVMLGFWGHTWVAPIAKLPGLKTGIVLCVMAMMAAPVPIELFAKTVTRPWPGMLATIICMGFVPGLGWLGAKLLPTDLAGGLIVACCVPSTLASAAVITRKAGGNETIPIIVTILTNVGCVILTPLWLMQLLGNADQMNLGELVQELAVLVLMPIVVVQLVRWRSAAFRSWTNKVKPKLSVACQLGILLMVMIGATQMAAKWAGPAAQSTVSLSGFGLLAGICLAVHLTALSFGFYAARITQVDRAGAIGVAFSGSQKTLMVGLNIAIDLGVSMLPMIAYHVIQLLADAMIAERWNRFQMQSSPPTKQLTKKPR